MFLTKKNAQLTNKVKNPAKKRPLGGWDDDEDSPTQTKNHGKTISQPVTSINLLQNTYEPSLAQQKILFPSNQGEKESNKQQLVYEDWDTLNSRSDIDCEKQLVENIVQPGGIRVKPSDNMLSQFLKQTRGMQVIHIVSLLLSKLEVNYPFQVKAKSLYIIEYLIKKNKQFENHFKKHTDKIKEFPEPEDNVESYKKIQKSVLNQLGTQISHTQIQQQKQVFVDPGYYNEPPKSQIGSFLEYNINKPKKVEGKKPIIGPGQAKARQLEKKHSQTVQPLPLNINSEVKSHKEVPHQSSTGLQNLLELSTSAATTGVNNDNLI